MSAALFESTRLPAPLLAAALLAACGATTAPGSPASDAGADVVGDAGSIREAAADAPEDCTAEGGRCVPAGLMLPSSTWAAVTPDEGVCAGTDVCWLRRAGAAVCSVDADCNSDVTVSALWGRCFRGSCICMPGLYLQRSGLCASTPPPNCAGQFGTCIQGATSCPAGMIEADARTNMSCGDFQAAVCCFSATSCKGPLDFTCCAPNDAGHAPICQNGWPTCPDGFAVTPGGFCG